jgi:hypothetical protein
MGGRAVDLQGEKIMKKLGTLRQDGKKVLQQARGICSLLLEDEKLASRVGQRRGQGGGMS